MGLNGQNGQNGVPTKVPAKVAVPTGKSVRLRSSHRASLGKPRNNSPALDRARQELESEVARRAVCVTAIERRIASLKQQEIAAGYERSAALVDLRAAVDALVQHDERRARQEGA